MKSIKLMDVVVLLVWLTPIVYLLYVYHTLPEIVPVHFGIDGKPDRMGSKVETATGVAILSGLAVGIYFLMKYLPKIDPKRNNKTSQSTFKKIAQAVVLLMSCIAFDIVYSTQVGEFGTKNLMLPMLGLFLAYLGNLMHSLKPNYFAGVRTPWTLESEANWTATHRLTSKIWVIGGIVIAIGTLLLPIIPSVIFFLSIVAIMVIIPLVFSFKFYRKEQQSKQKK